MPDILRILKTIIQSLFKKSACRLYPVKPATFFENSKGHIAIDANQCILCTLCEKRCPTNAIRVDRNAKTWEIDHFKCILCSNCIECCRPKCLRMENQYAAPALSAQCEKFQITTPVSEKN